MSIYFTGSDIFMYRYNSGWYLCFCLPEDEFQSVQTKFLAKYYTEFEDTEENKLSYTGIHKEYVSTY